MDIVIPLGTQDKRRNYADLRYSLRSVEKYIKGYKDIYIVGECPKWLTNVIHLPCKDPYLYKINREGNIIHKVLTAAQHPDVSEHFVLLNDDHYYLKRLHVDEIEDWYKGNLNENPAKNHLYQKARKDTHNWLRDFGGHTLDYDGHWPNVFHKEVLIDVMQGINWKDHHFVFKSLYYNLIENVPVRMKDCKIGDETTPEDFGKQIRGRYLFSTSDNVSASIMMRQYFDEHLNTPSRYES